MKKAKTFSVYDLEVSHLWMEYIKPGIQNATITNPRFEPGHFQDEFIRTIDEYGESKGLTAKHVLIDRHPLLIKSSSWAYFGVLSTALMFYDPVKIPDFLDYQYQKFEGNRRTSAAKFLGYVEHLVDDTIKSNSPDNNVARRLAILAWVKKEQVNPSKVIPVKYTRTDIKVADNKIIVAVLSAMESYFSTADYNLLEKLLSGTKVSRSLTFLGPANLFCEAIKRLSYYREITGTNDDLKQWILKYFQYNKAGTVRKFSAATIDNLFIRCQDQFEPRSPMKIEGVRYVPVHQRAGRAKGNKN
ncbi:MAG: hypothetical protein SFW35_03170 [Chitinophagales bacterium]|nr:hypothetical protein [Chitinophagales bacterium]